MEDGLLEEAIEDYDDEAEQEGKAEAEAEDEEMAPAELVETQAVSQGPQRVETADEAMPDAVTDPAVATNAVHAALLRPDSVDLMTREQLARCETMETDASGPPVARQPLESLSALSKEEILEILRQQLTSPPLSPRFLSPPLSPRVEAANANQLPTSTPAAVTLAGPNQLPTPTPPTTTLAGPLPALWAVAPADLPAPPAVAPADVNQLPAPPAPAADPNQLPVAERRERGDPVPNQAELEAQKVVDQDPDFMYYRSMYIYIYICNNNNSKNNNNNNKYYN